MATTLSTFEVVEHEDGNLQLNWVSAQPTPVLIDQLVVLLRNLRREMDPPFPTQLPRHVPTLLVHGVGLQAGRTPEGDMTLGVRDPGLGWHTYHLPPAAVEYLRDSIQAHLAAPAPPRQC